MFENIHCFESSDIDTQAWRFKRQCQYELDTLLVEVEQSSLQLSILQITTLNNSARAGQARGG